MRVQETAGNPPEEVFSANTWEVADEFQKTERSYC